MPPQPLSNIKRDATVEIPPVDLTKRPGGALWIASCISAWSAVEFHLGLMMIAFLGKAASPTVAIYVDLIAFRTRIEALIAAAKNTLSDEYYEIFEALISFTRVAAKKRDKLAHHLWTYSCDLPDALLLIDPRDLLPEFTNGIAKAIEGKAAKEYFFTEKDIKIDYNLIYVYKMQDFAELYAEFVSISNYHTKFVKATLGKNNSQGRKLFFELSHEPRILEYVSRQRQARQNNQSQRALPQPK